MPRRIHTRFARARRFVRFHLVIPVFRSPHPPEYTARGVAIGVFWGVTPFLGMQTLLMITTWQAMKRALRKDASLVQALAWSWINNPITMIPMYYSFYLAGLWLTGMSSHLGGYDAFAALWEASGRDASFVERVQLLARQLGLPLVVGCFPFAIAGSWLSYVWAHRMVRTRRRRISNRARAPAARHA